MDPIYADPRVFSGKIMESRSDPPTPFSSKPPTDAYTKGWEATFSKKPKPKKKAAKSS